MDTKACYRRFTARYFALGAGITAGFIAVSPPAAAASSAQEAQAEQPGAPSFADRLAAVRSAVDEHLDGRLIFAQIIRPPPPPPFFNVFGKAPFSDAFRNTPPPPPSPPPRLS